MELVQYRDTRQTKILDISWQEWGKIEIYTSSNVGQQLDMSGGDTLDGMVIMIKDWNIWDENGEKMEVNRDNLKKVLSSEDLVLLTASIAWLTIEELEKGIEDGTLEETIKKKRKAKKTEKNQK